MNTTFITTELIKATNWLLQLARNESYNIISNNCLYIISEIHTSLIDVETQRKLSNEENRKKRPVKLSALISALEAIYPLLYDINLYIYTTNSEHTIIDIRYLPKSSLSFEDEVLVTTNATL